MGRELGCGGGLVGTDRKRAGLGWAGLSKLLVLLMNLQRKVGRHLENAWEVADAQIPWKAFLLQLHSDFGFGVLVGLGRAVVTNTDKQFPDISFLRVFY